MLGPLDLKNRTIEVAVDIENCHFKGRVDLRYCEFKQAVKFCNCTFRKEFNSGDGTDSHTVYRKNLICDDAIFVSVARFRGLRCEGYALFRSARFLRAAPLKDETRGSPLERPPVDFTVASFKALECDGVVFGGAVSFRGVECAARASFQKARFEQHELLKDAIGTLPNEIGRTVPVDFTGASFEYLNALGATFNGAASFNGVKCTGDAVFKGAHFPRRKWEDLPEKQLKECNVDFKYSDFRSSLILQGARFKRPVTLKRDKISDTLNLNRATFCDSVSFYGTRIGRLRLRNSWFKRRGVDLRECTFESHAGFELLGFQDNGKPHEVLAWIVDSQKFSMDPYLQLEQNYNRNGDENKARAIYRQGRRRSRQNAWTVFRLNHRAYGEAMEAENRDDEWPWSRKLSDYILDYLTGYGLRIGRLFLIAAVFILLGFVVFSLGNTLVEVDASGSSVSPSETLVASTAPPEDQNAYGFWRRSADRFTYSVDLFIPLVKLGVDERWEPNGWGSQTYAFVHMFVGWLVVPLLLASLAGIFKR